MITENILPHLCIMNAEIITIGDELLIGQVVDTNSAWMAQRLNEAGVRVVRKQTVGDVPEQMAEVIKAALNRSDIVLLTGGLGPTKDDKTRDVLVSVEGSGDGQYLKVLPINNKELNDEVKQYLQNWSEKMNTPVVFVESPPP